MEQDFVKHIARCGLCPIANSYNNNGVYTPLPLLEASWQDIILVLWLVYPELKETKTRRSGDQLFLKLVHIIRCKLTTQ